MYIDTIKKFFFFEAEAEALIKIERQSGSLCKMWTDISGEVKTHDGRVWVADSYSEDC